MHTLKSMHSMEEHPDREAHPGLIDVYENPHPSVRALPRQTGSRPQRGNRPTRDAVERGSPR